MGMLLHRHLAKNDDQEQAELEKPTSASKVDEIKAYLTNKQIKFNESAKKDELLALVE